MGRGADRLGAGGVRRLLLRRRCLARAISGHTAAPARRAPPPAGTAVRVERLPRASGARCAARHLVWPHRRELTTAIGPRGGFRGSPRLITRWPVPGIAPKLRSRTHAQREGEVVKHPVKWTPFVRQPEPRLKV